MAPTCTTPSIHGSKQGTRFTSHRHTAAKTTGLLSRLSRPDLPKSRYGSICLKRRLALLYAESSLVVKSDAVMTKPTVCTDPTCPCWRRLADYVCDDLLRHEGNLERRTEMKEQA